MVCLLTLVNALPGMVLCVGADGSCGIEFRVNDSCLPAALEDHHEDVPRILADGAGYSSECVLCFDCVDIPLGNSLFLLPAPGQKNSLRDSQNVPSGVLPLSSAESLRSEGVSSPPEPERGASWLTFLQSVVLLY